MQDFRRHLAWLVCGWLACQMAGVVAAPIVLWRVADSQEHRECECPVAPGQACPMHHDGKNPGSNDSKHDDTTCKLRNAFPASDAVSFSQSGAFGILPGPMATLTVFHPSAVVRPLTPVAIAHAYVPEAPPPRS